MTQQQLEGNNRRLTTIVIGEESLLIQCAETLRERGHEVRAVVSNAPDIQDWATTSGLPVVPNDADLAANLRPFQFDYLFSVTNLRIIPDDVIAQARELAVNFHDSPLPAYAGLYATSWALLNGEDGHGVSWHTIESGIDEGDLLKQVLFDIADDETAYTLNVTCYEHAISSFAELVDELAGGSHDARPQDLSTRSYFGKFLRPSAAATINWTESVDTISALVRALDFGVYENPLGRAKILLDGGRLFVVESLNDQPTDWADEHKTLAEPGTILAITDSLVVAAGDGVIEIQQLIDQDRQAQLAGAVAMAAGCQVGQRLPILDAAVTDRLNDLIEQAARAEAGWVDDLATLTPIEIPYGDRTQTSERAAATSAALTLDESLSTHLQAQDGAAAFLVGAFAAYLTKLTGNAAFHLSYGAELGHDDAAVQPWFVPRLPLHCRVDPTAPIADAVADNAEAVVELQARAGLASDVGLRHPRLQGGGIKSTGLPLSIGVEIGSDLSDVDDRALPAPLDLILAVDEGGLAASWIYDANVYRPDVLARIEAQFISFTNQLIADGSQPLSELSLLSADDRRQIVVDWNATDKAVDLDTGLHQLFTSRAEEQGPQTAIVHNDRSMTYAELDDRSNRLAHQLQAMGAGPGGHVGIFMGRGLDMIVSLLGVLKAGAAYVPLDPTYPSDRVKFMIEDSGLVVLLTQSEIIDQVADYDGKVLCIDGDWDRIAEQPNGPVATTSSGDDLAYLIYTSGSTGKPKGVMVTHANAVNFLAGMDDHIPFGPGDTWLTVTSLSFDISVLEIFWSLTRGLQLVVFADEHSTGQHSPSQHSAGALVGGAPVVEVDRDMNFSLFYFASDESEAGNDDKYELLLEGARFADQHGFEAVWTPERHFYAFGGLYPNPAVTSAAIAAITDNVDIRAGSCVLPLHHPVRVAEEWAVVDNISKGRVGIAFAAGWQPVDFVLRPENFAERSAAVQRDVDIVQRLWRGETITMDGPTGPAEIRTLPRPIQPELPSWLTIAGNPDTFATAGAGGFNVLTHLLGQSVEELEDKIKIYRKARADAGHLGDGQVTLMLHTFIGDDVERVRAMVREPMIEYLRSSVSLIREAAWSFPTFQQKSEATGKSPMDLFDDEDLSDDEMQALLEHAFNRYFDGSSLFGTPATCRAMVNDLKRIGVDEIACQVDFGLAAEDVLAGLTDLNELRLQIQRPSEPVEDNSIPALIERHNVSHFQCTPSMGSMLVADDHFRQSASRLKVCLMGGEAFPQALAKEITDVVADGTVLNVYGPTETTIWSSVHRVDDGDQPVSIGRPLANQQMYVVDTGLQPCPLGVPGELLIGGDGVTKGYLDRAELTDERFVADHFRPEVADAKLYRTGDLVRYAPDGSIDFLGRMDFQVKVRGYRIELGEIEARLNEHPSVREAVVAAREDTPGDQRLVAYVIADANREIDGESLRAHLAIHLPDFMVPAHYVSLQQFPLTPNKKTDRKSLPAPDETGVTSAAVYVAPEDGVQQQLAEIWQQLLGTSHVGTNDNFFDMGGHSLLAVQLHRQIKSTIGADLSITDVFRFPTIASLTDHLAHSDEAADAAKHRVADRATARRQAMSNRRNRRRRS